VRGYFEDISPDIEHAYRIAGNGWWKTFRKIAIRWPVRHRCSRPAGLYLRLEQLCFALILASADKAAGDVARSPSSPLQAFKYGQDRRGNRAFDHPDIGLGLYAQRYLVEGLSLGA